ncbi:MAG TPA: TatD family hydrolase [Spirochaetales bacterium]|nr:TatD family hydrolase [Spirochaetales bacterium]
MKFPCVDFHTHLDLYDDPSAAVAQIESQGILTLASSMDLASYRVNRELSARSRFIIPTFGIHPARSGSCFDETELDMALNSSPILGECGLDALWVTDVPIRRQTQVFERILAHAHERGKYCVVHTKDAEEKVLDMAKAFPRARLVIHWYSGSVATYKRYLDMPFLFTYGCELRYSAHIRELLSMTPLERVLPETDNPVAEPWLGGTTDEPMLIRRVIEDIAREKGFEAEDAAATMADKARHILFESGVVLPA